MNHIGTLGQVKVVFIKHHPVQPCTSVQLTFKTAKSLGDSLFNFKEQERTTDEFLRISVLAPDRILYAMPTSRQRRIRSFFKITNGTIRTVVAACESMTAA